MKSVHARFYDKTFMKQYAIHANIRRAMRDATGAATGDMRAMPLKDYVYSNDFIEIQVFDGFTMVGYCLAQSAQIAAVDAKKVQDMLGVFQTAKDAGYNWAATQLELRRREPGSSDPALAPAVVVLSIEVMLDYKKRGIGTNMIDYLLSLTNPLYVAATIVPQYSPMVATNSTSLANTDKAAVEAFLSALKFKMRWRVELAGPVTNMCVPMYGLTR